ncbi:MAG: ABC transporter permease [Candidatus Omnitrophica bacterium]|nr:ABC transporter permease [Candidatus Omnitrophota bacterium]
MNLPFFISLRYLATKRKEKFISLISIISVLGVAIGVMALIIVIAVMAGFDRDLRDKIVGNYSHITIASYSGIDANKYETISAKLKTNRHVEGISPFVQGQILVKSGDRFVAVGIKGIDPKIEVKTTKLNQYLIRGSLSDLGDNSLFIGKELAFVLGVREGSIVTTFSPLGKQYSLKVAGIFYSGMYDYDMNLVFTNLKTSQELLGLGNQISGVSVKLDNLYLADKLKAELTASLGMDYNLRTWTEANQNFFAALKLEKLTMFIILTLIILVASFNIISTLIVMVVEKTKDIGILKAIGMTSAQIRKIFTYQGILIGAIGTGLGTCGGLLLCWLLKKYEFIKLPQDIYYIDRLPVAIQIWPDMILIILAAVVITLASTIYPAAKAAKFEPVEALRYE